MSSSASRVLPVLDPKSTGGPRTIRRLVLLKLYVYGYLNRGPVEPPARARGWVQRRGDVADGAAVFLITRRLPISEKTTAAPSVRRCCTENFKSEVWALSPRSRGFLGGTDGIRATGLKHAFQNRDADGGFGLLCPKLRANNPFVSADRGFHVRAAAIAGRLFAIPVALWPRSRRYGHHAGNHQCPASSLKTAVTLCGRPLLNGIIAPRRGRRSATRGRPSMKKFIRIGVDLAKN